MSKVLSKKSAVAGLIAAIVVAATAYAYLSSTGSGAGAGSTAATAPTVTLTGTTPAISAIGGTATMTIKAANNGTSPTKVKSISVGAITLPANCPPGSFEIATPEPTNTEVAVGATATTVGTAVVTFVNKPSVQDTCTSFSAALTSD